MVGQRNIRVLTVIISKTVRIQTERDLFVFYQDITKSYSA